MSDNVRERSTSPPCAPSSNATPPKSVPKAASQRLGVDLDEVTANGQFTVERAPCPGLCEHAPTALEVEIKKDVLTHGASVKGRRSYAVFSRGRVSWATDRLDAYATTHLEVVEFRKQGEPSVSLRMVR